MNHGIVPRERQMTMLKKQYLIIFMAVFLCTANFFAAEKILDKDDDVILATVNGEPITLFAVIAETGPQESQLSLMYSGKRLQNKIKEIRKNAIDDIIARKLISERFDSLGFKVPKQMIEKMLDSIAADIAGGDRKQLEKEARKAGLSMDDLKKQAQMRAATMMLINARCYQDVYITPKQIWDFYQKNKEDYRLPRKINLQMLYLKSKEDIGTGNIAQFAIKLRPHIIKADEKTFNEYVKTHSVGPNKEKGGDVGWVAIDKLRPEFSLAIQNKATGSIVGPIKTPEGFYFIRIKDQEAPKDKSFDSVKEAIKNKLEEDVKQKNYDKYIKDIRSRAVIRYFL